MSAQASKTVAEKMVEEALQRISDNEVKPLLQEIAASTSIIETHKKSIENNGKKIAEAKAKMDTVAKAMWDAFDAANAGA